MSFRAHRLFAPTVKLLRLMSITKELTLADLVTAVLRRRGAILLTFLVVVGLGLVLYKFLPRKYGSEGRLYVQVGRANSSLDPTANTKPISIQDSRETEVRSVLELARSQAVLRQVVDEVGAEAILQSGWKLPFQFPSLFSGGNPDPGGMSAAEYAVQKQRELAVKELQGELSIGLEKNTSVISLFGTAGNPKLAQAIVENIMQATQQKHVEVHATAVSRRFFQQEFDRQKQELDLAIEALRDFRNRHGFLSVDAARATEQSVLDKLELQLIDVDAELAQVQGRTDELELKLEEIPEMLSTPIEGKERLSTERALSDMFLLETERAKLLATYSEEHPKVVQITEQLKSLRQELETLPEERTELTAVPNKTYENVKTELVSATAALEGLEGRRETLQRQRRECGLRLQELNQLDVESQLLQRDIDVARRQLEVYIQKQGEAEVLDQLDKERISDVVIAQPAVLMVKHVSPNAMTFLPLCAAFGLGLGVLLALYLEWPKLAAIGRLPVEADSLPELPVLMHLPKVASRRAVVR